MPRQLPPPLYANLNGRTVIVTGANTGIGFEAAKHFARMGPARLILACRSAERGSSALQAIQQATGYKAELQLLDLTHFSCVVDFARRLGNDPVDILVENAALANPEYGVTTDGWERNIQVNHLSTALLAFLLLPNLVKAAEEHTRRSRLVIVGSGIHYSVTSSDIASSAAQILQRMSEEEFCTPQVMHARYPFTKVLNTFFTRAFAERLLTSAPVIPTVVDPGFCLSELRRHLPAEQQEEMRKRDATDGRTAEEGSRELLWAALGPDGTEGDHTLQLRGAFVADVAVRPPSDYVLSDEGKNVQDRIWSETVAILEGVTPEVREVLSRYF